MSAVALIPALTISLGLSLWWSATRFVDSDEKQV